MYSTVFASKKHRRFRYMSITIVYVMISLYSILYVCKGCKVLLTLCSARHRIRTVKICKWCEPRVRDKSGGGF